jgi:AraC-like DNA-binding protein
MFSARFRAHRTNLYLAAVLLLLAATKADQLFQMLGGLEMLPNFAFVLAPFQVLVTPALYFYVRSRVQPDFALRRSDWFHVLPFAAYALYLTINVYAAGPVERAVFLSDGLARPVNRLVIPILGDLLQLGYIVAVFVLLKNHGIALRDWYSRIEGRNLAWLGNLMAGWAAVFLLHLFLTIGPAALRPVGFLILNGAHFLFVTFLAVLALADFLRQRSTMAPVRYKDSTLSEEERVDLFARAKELMAEESLYRDPDLTLAELADRLAVLPRELSEAINGQGGVNFFEFVNRKRIEHAQARLVADQQARVLDIALDSGFGSKSAFNAAFKRQTGTSPTEYRR